jgi:glycine betaine catabolism B
VVYNNVMNYMQQLLDRTTMYRVVLYALTTIAFAALTLSVAGVLAVAPLALLLSFAVITMSAAAAHYACVMLFRAPGNVESSFITALILFLILTPDASVVGLSILALMGAGAIVLKYIVRYRLRHVFNPVALVLVLGGLFGYYGAEWWVGSRYLLPVVALAGLAVVVKTRRWPLVLTYIGVSAFAVVVVFWQLSPWSDTLVRHFLSWPTIFLAAFMLTEPLSLPGTKRLQYVYAALVGVLSSVPFHVGPLFGTPELALLVANLLTLVADKPARLRLSLVQKEEVGKGTVEYTFAIEHPVSFVPGQYLEWTLPHEKPDLRGIRRYFTIASAPLQHEVSFAVRHGEKQSSWKQVLASLAPGAILYATQRAGDFTLGTQDTKRIFIAGGIGVTPFVSMIRSAKQSGAQLNALLFYCNKTEADIAYDALLADAAAVGLTVVHVLQEPAQSDRAHEVGFITKDMLAKYEPNYVAATYYISGPPGLVGAYKKLARGLGVARRRVITDYFPGLA